MRLYSSSDDRPLSARKLRGSQGRTEPRHASTAFGGVYALYGRRMRAMCQWYASGMPVVCQ